MKELKEQICEKINEFQKDLGLNVDNGNKAAGVRARKATLQLEKLFKEYRKRSVNTPGNEDAE